MAVGIAEIDEHRVAWSMAAGAAFDGAAEAETAGDVAGFEQVLALLREVGDVMQAWAGAVEKDDVVRIAFALQEHAAQLIIVGDVFRQAEPHGRVERKRARYVRRENLRMVEPLRAAATVIFKARDLPRHHRHAGAEFEPRADRIGGVQRASLERHVGPRGRAPLLLEEIMHAFEIVFA